MARKRPPRGNAYGFHGLKAAKKPAKSAQAKEDSDSKSVSVSESSES